MKCTQVRSLLSPYLDGLVPGLQMQAIARHLNGCSECQQVYQGLETTQGMVAALGRQQAPPDLALRLRVALSRELSVTPRRRLQALMVRFENAVNAFMVPASAGLVSALLFFSLLLPFLAPGVNLAALAANDVPTNLYIAPRLEASGMFSAGSLDLDSPVVVETLVDANGRVQDYRIIAGEDSAEVRAMLNRTLIFTVFQPARAFGRPTAGWVVLSFNNVQVRG